MTKHTFLYLSFTGFLLLSISGCSLFQESSSVEATFQNNDKPASAIRRFRSMLSQQKWTYAYQLLSQNTRSCYDQDDFQQFMTKTKPGILIQSRFLHWKITTVNQTSPKKATVRLRHPTQTSFHKTYRVLLEKKLWRLDWSMAEAFGAPRTLENCRKEP